jgi:hypothetical protein
MMLDEGPTSISGLNASDKNVDFPSFTVSVSIKGIGGMSLLLTTHLIVSPPVILPEQPEEYVVVYPDTDGSIT